MRLSRALSTVLIAAVLAAGSNPSLPFHHRHPGGSRLHVHFGFAPPAPGESHAAARAETGARPACAVHGGGEPSRRSGRVPYLGADDDLHAHLPPPSFPSGLLVPVLPPSLLLPLVPAAVREKRAVVFAPPRPQRSRGPPAASVPRPFST